MRVLPLDGGDLEGARMDATLSFPARIKQDFQWRTGFPSVSIDDQPVEVIQNAARDATRREAVLRQRVRAARPAGPLCRHRGRRHPDAGRLFGLPRRRGREGAVSPRDHLDGRPIDDRAQPGAAERADRGRAVRETGAAEAENRGRRNVDSVRQLGVYRPAIQSDHGPRAEGRTR